MRIVSTVHLPRMRNLFGSYLQVFGGLMPSIRFPPGNMVWTDSAGARAEQFMAHRLTHSVDDTIYVPTAM